MIVNGCILHWDIGTQFNIGTEGMQLPNVTMDFYHRFLIGIFRKMSEQTKLPMLF